MPIRKSTHQGTRERFLEVSQKVNWKTKRPRTEIARSPYDVPYHHMVMRKIPPHSHTSGSVPCGPATHLRERETESRAENDGEKTQPAESELNVPRQAVERSFDERAPDSGDRLAYDRAGYESECNDPGKTRT